MSITTLADRKRLVKIVVGATLAAALLITGPPRAFAQSVVIYENPNFGGRSQTLGLGGAILPDFQGIASSIRVSTGLVALLYEHVDEGGGYGASIDLLEDRA